MFFFIDLYKCIVVVWCVKIVRRYKGDDGGKDYFVGNLM